MIPAFRPSQVVLAPIPFAATMGRLEREAAATILVRASVRAGDDWRPFTPQELGEAIRADLEEKVEPLSGLNSNPFFRPDFHDLVAAGYAASTLERGAPIEFTPKGFEALSRWVRKGGAS